MCRSTEGKVQDQVMFRVSPAVTVKEGIASAAESCGGKYTMLESWARENVSIEAIARRDLTMVRVDGSKIQKETWSPLFLASVEGQSLGTVSSHK